MSSIQTISIIPEPVSITLSSGKFSLTKQTKIYSDPNLNSVSEYLKNLIDRASGFNIIIENFNKSYSNLENAIFLKLLEENKDLQDEGYKLSVTPKNVRIEANKPAGIFYGIQTLRQLFPIKIESTNTVPNAEWVIPSLIIEDFPRFTWRGYMLDEARYFHGKEVVKKMLDLMSLLKLNKFHWHLTDDQGWRIEIKKYPKLIEIGSKREETVVGGIFSKKYDGIPHSGYYSQEDIREIIEYASDRFIQIIPEIDVPGHTRAVLASYPNLSCKGYPFRVSTHWGIHRDVLCIGKEEIFEFVQNVLKEIADLFPANNIHIGGDEVVKKRWKECPDCQLRLKEEGLDQVKKLQPYFTNRIISFLNKYKQEVIIWNDALKDNLKGKPICQYWFRKKNDVLDYLRTGGKAIMSDFPYVYLDHSYKFTPLKLAYKFEPIPKKLEKENCKRILGLEAPLWSEYIPNVRRLEWQTFPRLIAFAEIGWTPKIKKNFDYFQERLKVFFKRLDIIGVNYANLREVKKNVFERLFKVFTLFREQKGGI